MSIYRVEKSELPVVLFEADGSVMKGVVFLSATAYSHMGQQTLLDLMNRETSFRFAAKPGLSVSPTRRPSPTSGLIRPRKIRSMSRSAIARMLRSSLSAASS